MYSKKIFQILAVLSSPFVLTNCERSESFKTSGFMGSNHIDSDRGARDETAKQTHNNKGILR